ncbi:MAG: EamA/RhaT family transporter, partial [Microvirgula sp.]
MQNRSARLYAAAAILIWASLAALGVKLAHLPPFLLVGATRTFAGLITLPTLRQWRVPASTFAIGV